MSEGYFDIAIVGGGAAGLMAGLFAARSGRSTVLLEGSPQCGLKILVSGGGRCNVLPSVYDESDYFTLGSRNVVRRLFRTWSLDRVTAFFTDDLGVELTIEPETGKVFPRSQKAKEVRDALVAAFAAAGGTLHCGWRVTSLERDADRFRVSSLGGGAITASRVILATGGQSLPRTGSDGVGYSFAKRLGHTTVETYPALVPLTTNDEALRGLTGIALPVRWRAELQSRPVEERVRELLFTHRGFSGPAMLDASHWSVRDHARLTVGWNAISRDDWLRRLGEHSKKDCRSVVADALPRRLAEILCERAGVPAACTPSHLTRDVRERLLDHLTEFELPVTGSVGYRVAEVTGGGVPIGELHPSTLESRCTPGAYLCGEIVDLIGRIGGYNFLWAWVTGKLAGESAARSLTASQKRPKSG